MSRYIFTDQLEGDALLRMFPKGHCQWCGKALPKRCKWYCPSERVPYYAGSKSTYRFRRCWANYWAYWYRAPRFRRIVLLRDSFTCQKCGLRPVATSVADGIERPDLSLLHVDHIMPLARGGPNTLDNLQLLCARCNLAKGAKVPE